MVEILEEDGKIIIRKPVTILDLAGTGIGDPEEIQKTARPDEGNR